MNQIKLAIIVSHPIQHFCPQYVSYAKSAEWEVKVFFASSLGLKAYTDKNFNQTISWNNLQLERFPHVFLNGGNTVPVNAQIDAPELEDCLNDYDPKVVLIYGYYQKYQRRAYQWAINHKKKVLYISDSESRQKRNYLLKLLKFIYLKNFFKHIDAFLTVGDANEEYYQYYGVSPEKFFRTSFPIDKDLYNLSYSKREILRQSYRKEIGIAENEIVCSVVGKLIHFKNQVQIINALETINEPMTLLIIGSGPDEDSLKAKAASIKNHRIIFTGFVDPLELPKYYAATDIYIHPARIEPHSLAISEAIYMACPVIISNTCGSYGAMDDVQPGKNGFVYEWSNKHHLAQIITKLASDAALRKRFGDHSRNSALTFQENAHGKGLMAALTNILCNEN